MKDVMLKTLMVVWAVMCFSCDGSEATEEVVQDVKVSYTLYLDLENGSAPDGHAMNAMLKAFREGLGVEENDFYLYGDMDECDSYVNDKCESVCQSFKYGDWPSGFYSPRVMNNNRKRVIWGVNFGYF